MWYVIPTNCVPKETSENLLSTFIYIRRNAHFVGEYMQAKLLLFLIAFSRALDCLRIVVLLLRSSVSFFFFSLCLFFFLSVVKQGDGMSSQLTEKAFYFFFPSAWLRGGGRPFRRAGVQHAPTAAEVGRLRGTGFAFCFTLFLGRCCFHCRARGCI